MEAFSTVVLFLSRILSRFNLTLDLPTSRAENFSRAQARVRNFLCFRWQSERERRSVGAYYRDWKREAKNFEKV